MFSTTKDARQVPHRGQIEAFHGRALVGRAVAKKRHCDAAGAELLGRQRRAAHQRRSAADDAVGTHHALAQIGDMHGTALAAAKTRLLAINLGHHGIDVTALGDRVAMAAVIAGDLVALVEMHAEAGRAGFFPGIKMHEAGNIAGGEFHVQPLLEFADGFHHPVGSEQFVFAELHA